LNTQDNLQNFLPSWVTSEGEASDVAISSRIRLARNLKGIPFTNYANETQLNSIIDEIDKVFKEKPPMEQFSLLKVGKLTPNDRLSLVEKHLCSPQFIDQPNLRMLLTNDEQSVSDMVNGASSR
jgi:protein arginine kinase